MVPNLFGVGDRFVASRLPGFPLGDFEPATPDLATLSLDRSPY